MDRNEIGYRKSIKNNGDIVYETQWSPYYYAQSKFDVLKKLTEMTGIYVVFYLNKYKRLAPIMLGAAWYTGLRPSMLRIYDKFAENIIPNEVKNLVENEKIYYKFLEIYDLEDFIDIFYKCCDIYGEAYIDNNGLEKTNRTERVYLIDHKTKIFKRSLS